ncbi:MAG: neutral/alkaline non-lysosomal ceramidase N-terminal domain-containing protein [Candidatus Latescibacteria bacterium]|nr:neutral/alkaline non-lysosomal ceramidase N-terminal domain-containing protein [Candidatus Latescibacterota bacterium]
MFAGAAKNDITPEDSVWMDGMIRDHTSVGVHDNIYSRVLVLAHNEQLKNACVIVSVEVCGLLSRDTYTVRRSVSEKTGIPYQNIIIAATHTHSGPATIGFFNHREKHYLEELLKKIEISILDAVKKIRSVKIGLSTTKETTISHYRRLLAEDGHVVMNWEPYPTDKIKGPLGEVDSEVGIMHIVNANNTEDTVCILFNHAGHPNIMSGDNYLISGDYPGYAMNRLENKFGGTTLFVNGAQGTMDIDGLRDRDWSGVERAGTALSDVVADAIRNMTYSDFSLLHSGFTKYTINPRIITESELKWADNILKDTAGSVKTLVDGVGDDYKALLFKRLHDWKNRQIEIEHTCIAIDDYVFISFPGELFTEIGKMIKDKSSYVHTFIIGLANGEIGYVPTKKAILEGGYAVETREVCNDAEDIIVAQCLTLLNDIYDEIDRKNF